MQSAKAQKSKETQDGRVLSMLKSENAWCKAQSMAGDCASEPPGTRLTRTSVPESSMYFYVSCVDIFITYVIIISLLM